VVGGENAIQRQGLDFFRQGRIASTRDERNPIARGRMQYAPDNGMLLGDLSWYFGLVSWWSQEQIVRKRSPHRCCNGSHFWYLGGWRRELHPTAIA